MENFTPTSYTLECVATGREFEDTGWVLSDPQCKTPSLVRARYAKRQIDVKPAEWGLYRFADWMPVRRMLKGSSAPVTYKSRGLAERLGLDPDRIGAGELASAVMRAMYARAPEGAGRTG